MSSKLTSLHKPTSLSEGPSIAIADVAASQIDPTRVGGLAESRHETKLERRRLLHDEDIDAVDMEVATSPPEIDNLDFHSIFSSSGTMWLEDFSFQGANTMEGQHQNEETATETFVDDASYAAIRQTSFESLGSSTSAMPEGLSASPGSRTPPKLIQALTPIPAPTRRIMCPYDNCGKLFSCHSNLSKHKRSHAGIRSFVCRHEGCGHAFFNPGHLARHVASHSESRDHVCSEPGCLKSFHRRDQLTKHLQVHTNSNRLKSFACDFAGCEKQFGWKSSLQRHQKSHSQLPSSQSQTQAHSPTP